MIEDYAIEEPTTEPFESVAYQRRVILEKAMGWRLKAPCRGMLAWASSNKRSLSQESFIAELCDVCPYVVECLEIALTFKDSEMVVWGGLTGDKREALIEELLADDPDFYRFWSADNPAKITSLARRATAKPVIIATQGVAISE